MSEVRPAVGPHNADVKLIRESLISMENMPEALHEFDLLMEEREAFWFRFKLYPMQRIEELQIYARNLEERLKDVRRVVAENEQGPEYGWTHPDEEAHDLRRKLRLILDDAPSS